MKSTCHGLNVTMCRVVARPMVVVALCTMFGVWAGRCRPLSRYWIGALGGAGWLVALVGLRMWRRRRYGHGSSVKDGVVLLLLSVGMIWGAWWRTSLDGQATARAGAALARLAPGHVQVVGMISSEPEWVRTRKGDRLGLVFSVKLAEAGGADTAATTDVAGAEVRVIRYGWGVRPAYGERWMFNGNLSDFHRGNTARERGARRMILQGRTSGAVRVAPARGWARVVQRCLAGRRAAARVLAVGIDDVPEAVGLLHALLLGYRHNVTPGTREIFQATGTLHIFAISGLHVGIIMFLITLILRGVGVSRQYWVLVLGPVLIAYTLATGARPSAVRACIMAIVYTLAPLLARRPDVLSSLATAAVLILWVAPAQLFEAGFVFSFVVVTGLVLMYPHLEKPLRRFWQRDPFLPPPKDPDPHDWRARVLWILEKARRAAIHETCSLVALSVAAWLASAPLTAYYFGRFAPIALVGNLVVIPLAFAIVLTGCLSLVLGPCAIWMGSALNHVNVGFIRLLVWILAGLHRVPGGTVTGNPPPLGFVLAWYAVLIGLVVLLTIRRTRRG